MDQTTSNILMVSPNNFSYNLQTAKNNHFQLKSEAYHPLEISKLATREFYDFVDKLEKNGVNVIIQQPSINHVTPDAVFPNNWITFHQNGTVVIYPMYAPNRRLERNNDILKQLSEKYSFEINRVMDMSKKENQNLFLEGTGSMVLDRVNRILYATISERTSIELINQFASTHNYDSITFNATQKVKDKYLPIYHTNVMFSVGTNFALVCLDSILDKKEKQTIEESILKTDKEIIDISAIQMLSFCGNILEIKNNQSTPLIVMSTNAFEAFDKNQIKSLEKYGDIIHSPLNTIEKYGGGSARCMIAEVFLPKKTN